MSDLTEIWICEKHLDMSDKELVCENCYEKMTKYRIAKSDQNKGVLTLTYVKG